RQRERQVLDEQAVTVALAQVLDLDDGVTEARAGRDGDLELAGRVLGLVRLGEQLLVRAQARLALRLARLGAHTDPFELPRERALARVDRLRLLRHPIELLLEPARV